MDKAVLVGIRYEVGHNEADDDMQELRGLAEAVGMDVAMVMVQTRRWPDRATFIGKGKLGELARLLDELGVEQVVFNTDLSPVQVRNLEEALEARVWDRTMLILEIFNRRAYSREGKLQVELATLQYRLPRLTGRGRDMSRTGGGIGARGAGEQQLELDRRYIRKRIQDLKVQLAKVEKTRHLHSKRRQRAGFKSVSLVGYTNAGKSSLFNSLCRVAHSSGQNQVDADYRLFQTLDTTTRNIKLPSGRELLITDTVGFISHLPHHLVAAFRSTLKETLDADLLLHVVDRADPLYLEKMQVVDNVLRELEAGTKPTVAVFNKADLLGENLGESMAPERGTIMVSARTGQGIGDLLRTLDSLT